MQTQYQQAVRLLYLLMEGQISQVQCLKVGDAHYGVGQHYSGSVAKACTMLKMQIIHLSQNGNVLLHVFQPYCGYLSRHIYRDLYMHKYVQSPVIQTLYA